MMKHGGNQHDTPRILANNPVEQEILDLLNCYRGEYVTSNRLSKYAEVLRGYAAEDIHAAAMRWCRAPSDRGPSPGQLLELVKAVRSDSGRSATPAMIEQSEATRWLRCQHHYRDRPKDNGEYPQCNTMLDWPPVIDGNLDEQTKKHRQHLAQYCDVHRPFYSENRYATSEEIDEVFAEALANHPNSKFLQEMIAERQARKAKYGPLSPEQEAALLQKAFVGGLKTVPPLIQQTEADAQAEKQRQRDAAKAAGLKID
jgi:hypothetical protein